MVRPTPASADRVPAAGSAALPDSPSAGPSRPQGVGLTALALGACIVIELIRSLSHLFGGPLTAPLNVGQFLQSVFRCLALLLVWQYWKGRDFARVFVLLGSLLVVVRAVAFLADHNLDPAALMSRPLSFFQALLAVFLLYWLNTPPLRAWFKKTSATEADLIADRLVGKLCTALDFHPSATDSRPVWRLTFEHSAELTLSCPWRIVLDDNLAFTYVPAAGSAHAPAAGSAALPNTPVSVPDPSADPGDARRLLQNLRITAVRLVPHTSDLFLTFEMGIQLQTWNPALSNSPTTPLWQFSDPALTVIANPGGVSSQLAAPPTND
jgi:hypothetical protein